MADWSAEIRARLAGAGIDPSREADIVRELATHLDDRYEELRGSGVGHVEARQAALDELRDAPQLRAQLRAIERSEPTLPPPGMPARPGLLSGIWTDARYALRRLLAAPAFTVFSVITLALGIGATTAVYSAIYTAALRPPAIAGIERVMNLYHRDPRGGGSLSSFALAPPDIDDYAAVQASFAALAPWARFRHALVAGDHSEVIAGEMVGGDYFTVVGVEAALGRTLQPADDRPGASRVIVLEDGLWKRRFGGDPGVLGRTVNLGGDLFEVVGVMPPAFRGVDVPNVMPTAAWVPLSSTRSPNNDSMTNRERRWLLLKGRLKPGVSIEQARAEFQAVGRRLDLEHPIGQTEPGQYRARHEVRRDWFAMPAGDVTLHETMDHFVGAMVATIMVAVGLVLMVACTNIANLMLARGTARRHEHAVRLALGASRWRLVREVLMEAALVTAAGGLAAWAVARVLMTELLTATYQMTPGFVIRFEPDLHRSVGLVAAASTLLALVVFGLIPAWHTTRGSVRDALASDGSGAAAPRWRGRRTLIAAQVTVSAGLVAVAFLCAQQVALSRQRDSGMDLDRIALASVDFRLLKQDEAHGRRVLDEALHRARLQPGVEAAALASGLPAAIDTPGVYVRESSLRGGIELITATPDLFRALGIGITAGRAFDSRDSDRSAPVAVVSEHLARALGGEAVIGRTIEIERQRFRIDPPSSPRTVAIVGVAAETDTGVLGQRRGATLYVPFGQHYESGMTLVVRAVDPAPLPLRLRQIFRDVDPNTAVLRAETGTELADAADGGVLEAGALGAGLLGGFALVLAMAGLYGVLADLVARRTREIGIRVALGADRSRLVRSVLLDGLRPVGYGLLLGIAFGAVLRLTFRPFFVQFMPAFDPMILLVVPLAFLACAALAAYVPARRAARVDPIVALRSP